MEIIVILVSGRVQSGRPDPSKCRWTKRIQQNWFHRCQRAEWEGREFWGNHRGYPEQAAPTFKAGGTKGRGLGNQEDRPLEERPTKFVGACEACSRMREDSGGWISHRCWVVEGWGWGVTERKKKKQAQGKEEMPPLWPFISLQCPLLAEINRKLAAKEELVCWVQVPAVNQSLKR